MTRRILIAVTTIAAMGAALALAACDKSKPRHLPPDPMAVTPPQPASGAPPVGSASAGLPKREGLARFSIDSIGSAVDPLNHQPATTSASLPIAIRGFGFDPVANAPGKGLDVVIDGKAYRTAYGAGRDDVAAYFKNPGVTATAFTTTLPVGTLPIGPHTAKVRVVTADGKGYFDGMNIAFEVR